jgi:hypothetical protein
MFKRWCNLKTYAFCNLKYIRILTISEPNQVMDAIINRFVQAHNEVNGDKPVASVGISSINKVFSDGSVDGHPELIQHLKRVCDDGYLIND